MRRILTSLWLLLVIDFGLCGEARASQQSLPGVTSILLSSAPSSAPLWPTASHVSLRADETAELVAPAEWAFPIQWTKDGQPLTGATGKKLVLGLLSPAQSGHYSVTGAPATLMIPGVVVEVVERGRVGNFSARLELAAGDSSQIVGFTVGGQAEKTVLIRAVGPSLKTFGVSSAVAGPQFRLFDAAGREVVYSRVAIAINWEKLFAAAGAFPLTEPGEMYDYYTLPAGSYTLVVRDATAKGGTMLIETYELPLRAFSIPAVNPP